MQNFAEVAKKFVGQKVSLICARYQYRGVLSEVTDDCVVLSDAVSVEQSGPAAGVRAVTEDPINGSVVIKNDAVEILYQPAFAMAPLPSENGWTPTATR